MLGSISPAPLYPRLCVSLSVCLSHNSVWEGFTTKVFTCGFYKSAPCFQGTAGFDICLFSLELSSPGESRQRDHIVLLVVDSSFLWCWGQRNGKRIRFPASPYMGLLASNNVSFLWWTAFFFFFFHLSLFSAEVDASSARSSLQGQRICIS